MATIAFSPWVLVLIRALKSAQEGQLPPGLAVENGVVLASQVAKYGTRLISQVRSENIFQSD